MNNRNLLIAAVALFVAIPAFAGVGHTAIVAQVIKHVVPYDTYVWSDDSSEVIMLVGVKETGQVQELAIEQTTGVVMTKSKFDQISLLQIEPFQVDGKEYGFSSVKALETKES